MPFEMDDEFARHAVKAVTVPDMLLKSASAASKRVDIRQAVFTVQSQSIKSTKYSRYMSNSKHVLKLTDACSAGH